MSTSEKRRMLLKGSLVTGMLSSAMMAGLLAPRMAHANWPKEAFEASEIPAALKALTGYDTIPVESSKVTIKVRNIVDNGTMVSIEINADLPEVDAIIILSPDDPLPLVANFNLGPGVRGHISTRMKKNTTGYIVAIAKTGSQLHLARHRANDTRSGPTN